MYLMWLLCILIQIFALSAENHRVNVLSIVSTTPLPLPSDQELLQIFTQLQTQNFKMQNTLDALVKLVNNRIWSARYDADFFIKLEKTLDDKIVSQNKHLEQLKSEVAAQNKHLKQTKSEVLLQNKQVENEIVSQNKHLEDVKSAVTAQNKHLEQVKSEVVSQNNHLEQIKSEVAAQNQHLEQVVLQNKQVKNEVVSQNQYLKQMKTEVVLQNKHLEQVKNEVVSQNQYLKQVKSEVVLQNKHLEQFKSEVVSQNNHLEQIKSEVAAQNQHLEQVKNEVVSQNKQVKNEIISQNKHLEDVKNEVAAQNKHQEQVKNEIASQNKHLEDMKSEIVAQNKHLEQVKSEVASQNKHLVQIKSEEDAQNKQLGEMKSEVKQVGLELGKIYDLLKKMHNIETMQKSTKFPEDCREIQRKGTTVSGIYKIKPILSPEPFEVLCDMDTQRGGWVHVIKRFDGSQDFYLNWTDYKDGFGNLTGEFWLGLNHLYELTNSKRTELLIELEDWDGKSTYALYGNFIVGNEQESFKMKYLSGYSGTATDMMTAKLNNDFWTTDRDTRYKFVFWGRGPWWYPEELSYTAFCYKLTAKYFGKDNCHCARGLIWNSSKQCLKKAKMLIRPS